jgi:hypothetical protein
MIWNIHYKNKGAAGYLAVSSFEVALDRACDLLDRGAEVSEVASSGGCKRLDEDALRVLWVERRAKKLIPPDSSAAMEPAPPRR